MNALTGVLAVEETGLSAGPLGLLVVVLLGLGTVLLIRNMNGRLKRLPRSFDDRPSTEDNPPSGRPQ